MKWISFVLIMISFSFSRGNAQSFSLDLKETEAYVRRDQLLGRTDSSVSFNVRPVQATASNFLITSGLDTLSFAKPVLSFRKFNSSVALLPLHLYSEYNSHHPYGWNNGALKRARGLQSTFSAGIFAKAGPVRLQLRPELIYLNNPVFQALDNAHPSPNNANYILERYYGYVYNRIDLPERFGNVPVLNLLPGQSSLKVNLNDYAAGISTENIWWGPAKRNALVMSNNPQGFAHLTFHTRRPVKTKIGSFEGQVLAGRLLSSGYFPPQQNIRTQKSSIFNPKDLSWRYLTGLTVSYNPKWVPGLFVGFAKTTQQYHKDLKKLANYFPLFLKHQRQGSSVVTQYRDVDQYTSAFVRWLWKDANAEWFFEYGKNDGSDNVRDFLTTPERSRAFTFGIVKLTPLKRKDQYIQTHVEVTQLQHSIGHVIFDANSWYTHNYIRQGYTHKGEVLGAGIGPGSNVQFLEVSWIKGFNKIGLQVERLVNNNDFHYFVYTKSLDFRRHWIDLSGGINVNYQYGQFLFSGKFQYVRTLNYWWELNQQPEDPYFINGEDVTNLHATFGATYMFR